MPTRFKNPVFGKRLARLYLDKGIDVYTRGWASGVAADFFGRGIVKYKDIGAGRGVETNQAKERDSIKTQLQKHVSYESITRINTIWVCRYLKYFNCSAAYLFGEIEHPTIEQTDICEVTGLEPRAVQTLIEYKRTAPMDKYYRSILPISSDGSEPDALYNLLPDTVSFLLRPEHCKPNDGGLLHLIGHYITADDLQLSPTQNTPKTISIQNYNGSGLIFKTLDLIDGALPNMIKKRLEEYRIERLRGRITNSKQKGEQS